MAYDPVDGWRQAWAIFAGVTFAIMVIVLVALRNWPADLGLDPIGGPIVRPAGASRGMRAVLGLRSLWLLSSVYACFGFAYVIYATFLPSFIQQDRGLGVEIAGRMWIASGFASLVGPTAFGWLSDRIGRRYTLALLLCLLGGSLFALIWLPIEAGSWIAAVAYGFAGGSIVGLVAAASGDYAGPTLAPAALGFASIFLGIGQTVGPLVAGPIADQTGSFVPSLLSSAVLAWVGATVALFLPKPVRRTLTAMPEPSRAAPMPPFQPMAGDPPPDARPDPTFPEWAAGRGSPDRTAGSATTEWPVWAQQVVAAQTTLAGDLAYWSARTPDPELAEVLEIAAARARDRAYRLRRLISETAGESFVPSAARPTASRLAVDSESDLDLLDRLLSRPSDLDAAPPLPPASTERALLDRLRHGEAETIDWLREQWQRRRAESDHNQIRIVEGQTTQRLAGEPVSWQVGRPASLGLPWLARVCQVPGTVLHLPALRAPQIVIWLAGAGAYLPLDQPGNTVGPGQIVEIAAETGVDIAVTGDWPATYLIMSQARPAAPHEVGGGSTCLSDEARPASEIVR